MIIAVDFDGTCVTHEYPNTGKGIGAVPVLKALVDNGHKLILFTMRSNDDISNCSLNDAVQWFKNNGIRLFGVNTNPSQYKWTTSPKAYAELYIDDAALGIPLKYDENLSSRPFVDWDKVKIMLQQKQLI